MTVISPVPKLAEFVSKAAVMRAAIAAIIIGLLLTLINQRGAIFGAEEIAVLPLILIFQTPFLVVLAAQLLATRRAMLDRRAGIIQAAKAEQFIQTTAGHGIPLRAAVLGALMGTLNSGIIIAVNVISTGAAGPLPTPLIAQAFILPVLFGLISQTLAYRRALAQFTSDNSENSKGDPS